MTHAVQVPHDDDLVHVYHSEHPMTYDYAVKVLKARHPESLFTTAHLKVNFNGEVAEVWFIPDPGLPINAKATVLCAQVFGWHMVFSGDVVIEGLPEEQVENFIRSLG